MARLLQAVARGAFGRCPSCGSGRLLSGYLAPVDACPACGLDLRPFQSADLAPYLVVFLNGILFTPAIVALELAHIPHARVLQGVLIALALAIAATLLPRAKGVGIALNWVLGVRNDRN